MRAHFFPVLSRALPLAVFTSFAMFLGSSAHAQGQDDERPVSLGVGAGLAHSFHGDLNFYDLAGEGEVAIRMSRRLSLEVGAARWRHLEETVRLDVPITGPSGPIGTAARIEERSERVFSSYEANVVAKWRAGRVRIGAGGGAGMMTMVRTFRQTTEGCSGAATCGVFENEFSSASGTLQAIGRVEVPFGSRVSAYVATRLWVNLQDVGSSGTRTMAGVRIGI